MIQIARSNFYIECSAFERVREKLLSEPRDTRLDEVLGRWVRPSDRSLPLAFLGRTLRDLLRTPFQQLKETRGVGPKKIACMIELLERAAGTKSVAAGRAVVQTALELHRTEPVTVLSDASPIDASPTDAIWDQWREAVVAHGLTAQPLGRLVASLADLPRPMWHTTLGTYAGLTLEELGRLNTHGQRRLSAIFEIFSNLYELLGGQRSSGHLCVGVEPKFVRQLEDWIHQWSGSQQPLDAEEVERGFVAPLVVQLRIDGGDSLAEMALASAVASGGWRRAIVFGSTRSDLGRNWYYLDKIQAVITARWPDGAERVCEFAAALRERHPRSSGLELLRSASNIFFGLQRGQWLAIGTG